METALDELQRRICRLVLEALLAELQVRLQVGIGVGGGDAAYMGVHLCRGNASSGSFLQPHFCPNPQPLFAALPSRRWLSSPELLDDVCERTARFCQDFRRVRNPAAQVRLRERLGSREGPWEKHAEPTALSAAAPGRGGTYGSTAIPACTDAGPPGVPRSRREDPGGRAPAARRGPASGTFPWLGESSLGEQMSGNISGWVEVEGERETYPAVLRAWRRVFSARQCSSLCGIC